MYLCVCVCVWRPSPSPTPPPQHQMKAGARRSGGGGLGRIHLKNVNCFSCLEDWLNEHLMSAGSGKNRVDTAIHIHPRLILLIPRPASFPPEIWGGRRGEVGEAKKETEDRSGAVKMSDVRRRVRFCSQIALFVRCFELVPVIKKSTWLTSSSVG